MSVIPKYNIPCDCPGCGVPTLSDEFYCTDCAEERRDERELDEEMNRTDDAERQEKGSNGKL